MKYESFQSILVNKGLLINSYPLTNINNGLAEALDVSFRSIGFALDEGSLDTFSKLSENDAKSLYNELFSFLKNLVGDIKHFVFYKDFPDLGSLSRVDLYIRAILHYSTATKDSYGFILPEAKAREVELKLNNPKIIKLVTLDEASSTLKSFYLDYFEGKRAIPNAYHKVLKDIYKRYKPIPRTIPFKENMCLYTSFFIDDNSKLSLGEQLLNADLSFLKTTTDILRFYVVLSGGSPNLIGDIKLIHPDRLTRRIFISKINSLSVSENDIACEMGKNEFLYKRFLEYLHIGEYKQYHKACNAASLFRNELYTSFEGNIERQISNKNKNVLYTLAKRPGMYARSLSRLLRLDFLNPDNVLGVFLGLYNEIASNILIDLWSYFNSTLDVRIFPVLAMYGTKYFVKEETREPLSDGITKKCISTIEEMLSLKYRGNEKIENIYVSQIFDSIAVPTNERDKSVGYNTLPYGSRIKLENNDNNIIRFFTHWHNKDDKRVDIDLSLELYDENCCFVRSLSWHNIYGNDINCFHSGDIVTAPQGASEFVDVDYNTLKKHGRYAVICNTCYTGIPFAYIPECFSGIMFRENLGKKGEIFEPKDVITKFDLTSNTNYQVACILDLYELELIWVDKAAFLGGYDIIASQEGSISLILKQAISPKMSISKLLSLHKYDMSFVSEKEKAEVIYDEGGIKPTDIEKLTALI